MSRPATVTLEQVAAELQVSMRTVYRRVQDRTIPAFKVGTLWRCPVSYIDSIRGGPAANTVTMTAGDHNEQEAPLPERNARKGKNC